MLPGLDRILIVIGNKFATQVHPCTRRVPVFSTAIGTGIFTHSTTQACHPRVYTPLPSIVRWFVACSVQWGVLLMVYCLLVHVCSLSSLGNHHTGNNRLPFVLFTCISITAMGSTFLGPTPPGLFQCASSLETSASYP